MGAGGQSRMSRMIPISAGVVASRVPPPSGGAVFATPLTLNHAGGVEAGETIIVSDAMFAPGHGLFANGQADGGDLRAYADAGLTQRLPLELIAYDAAAETLAAAVRTPTALAQNDRIFLTRDNAGGLSLPADAEPFGKHAVWADYAFVSHDLSECATPGHSITLTGTTPYAGPNSLPARGFGSVAGVDAADKALSNYTGYPTAVTHILLSYRLGQGDGIPRPETIQRIFDKGYTGPAAGEAGEFFGVLHYAGNRRQYRRLFADGDRFWERRFTENIGAWAFHAVTHDGASSANEAIIIEDGGLGNTAPVKQNTGALTPNTAPLCFGNHVDGTANWNGALGMYRQYAGVKSITALFSIQANLMTPAVFMSAGAGAAR